MNLLIFLIFLVPFPFCFASSSCEDEISRLLNELQDVFYPAIEEVMDRGDEFIPLGDVPIEIESYLLSKTYISEQFYDQIIQLVNDKLNFLMIDYDTSESILSLLRFICGSSNKKLLDSRKPIVETNRVAIKVLADICHLFKTPLQRLILTSKAYGHGEMFKDAFVLLENIRTIFLFKTDVVLFFDFNEKLNFILASLDYYFIQRKPECLNSLAIYEILKSEVMTQIINIIEDIKAESKPLEKYYTGLGISPIYSNLSAFDSERSTTNEDLWAFIVGKVNETRVVVESSFPDLFTIQEFSVIDVINEDLLRKSCDYEVFNLEKARTSVINNSSIYFASLKETLRSQMEPEAYIIITDQIDKAGQVLMGALGRFSEELSAKVQEIADKLGLTCEELGKVDLAVAAVSELAKDKATI